jgi:hypothetical protein
MFHIAAFSSSKDSMRRRQPSTEGSDNITMANTVVTADSEQNGRTIVAMLLHGGGGIFF